MEEAPAAARVGGTAMKAAGASAAAKTRGIPRAGSASGAAGPAGSGPAMTDRGGGQLEPRRFARVPGVKFFLSLLGVTGLALAAEVSSVRSFPFVDSSIPSRFVPGVGVLWKPHEEVRHTNLRDFWMISRANRLGFLDREPISPRRAASGCHVALVGDSFVEAREVEVADKLQVRLEALAARDRPDWNLTTSAFGRGGIGQVQQVPFHDAYIRRMSPAVVVLVTRRNDFAENSRLLRAVLHRRAPGCTSWASAVRGEDGSYRLRLPHPSCQSSCRSSCRVDRPNAAGVGTGAGRAALSSALAQRAWRVLAGAPERTDAARRDSWRRLRSAWPVLSGWRPPSSIVRAFAAYPIDHAETYGAAMAPVIREAYDSTSFALAEFRRRGQRDGFELLLLLADYDDPPESGAMRRLAERLGIPVVSARDSINGLGENGGDTWFSSRDRHWTPKGHRLAAEALWRYLEEHPPPCGSAEAR